jgi:hypothetical protein
MKGVVIDGNKYLGRRNSGRGSCKKKKTKRSFEDAKSYEKNVSLERMNKNNVWAVSGLIFCSVVLNYFVYFGVRTFVNPVSTNSLYYIFFGGILIGLLSGFCFAVLVYNFIYFKFGGD